MDIANEEIKRAPLVLENPSFKDVTDAVAAPSEMKPQNGGLLV